MSRRVLLEWVAAQLPQSDTGLALDCLADSQYIYVHIEQDVWFFLMMNNVPPLEMDAAVAMYIIYMFPNNATMM